jgi:hypothetical protein
MLGCLTPDERRLNALIIQLKTLGYPHNARALDRVASGAGVPTASLALWWRQSQQQSSGYGMRFISLGE